MDSIERKKTKPYNINEKEILDIVAAKGSYACDGRPAHSQNPYRNTYCPVKSSHNKCLIWRFSKVAKKNRKPTRTSPKQSPSRKPIRRKRAFRVIPCRLDRPEFVCEQIRSATYERYNYYYVLYARQPRYDLLFRLIFLIFRFTLTIFTRRLFEIRVFASRRFGARIFFETPDKSTFNPGVTAGTAP